MNNFKERRINVDNNLIIDIEKTLADHSSSLKSAHKRIDELQDVIKAFYSLASDVKVIVSEMKTMKTDINDIKENIEEYHHKEPNKLMFNAKNAIITGIIGLILGAIFALILK